MTDAMKTNIVVVRENPRFAVTLSWMGICGRGREARDNTEM